jgi:Rad3-related DNA helicase
MPFDHPAHTVLSKRAEHFRNAFMEYTLPRLEHRLFRILRTFSRYRTDSGDVQILDKRLFEKEYGKRIRAYLEQFNDGENEADGDEQINMF